MIVDANVHIFPEIFGRVGAGLTSGPGCRRVAFGRPPLQLLPPFNDNTTYTPDMLLVQTDWAGDGKAVLIQGTAYQDRWDPAWRDEFETM